MSREAHTLWIATLGLIIVSSVGGIAMSADSSSAMIDLDVDDITYSEILNHNIQVIKSILTKWNIPEEHYVWRVLENASLSSAEISRYEHIDREFAREKFNEAMKSIYHALSLVTEEYVGNSSLKAFREFMLRGREINALNETLQNIKLKLSILNQSSTRISPTLYAAIDNASLKLRSLNQYLEVGRRNITLINNTYFENELSEIKEMIRTLNSELNETQLIRTKERLFARFDDRLKNLKDKMEELKGELDTLSRLGSPLLVNSMRQRFEGLTKAMDEITISVDELKHLSNVEQIRRAPRISEVMDLLSLRMAELNTTFKYVRKAVDMIYGKVAEINETSERISKRLEHDGRIPPTARERISHMLKIASQLTYLSDELVMGMLTDVGNVSEALGRFEDVIREGRKVGKDLRDFLSPYNQFSRDLIPLIDRIEGSLNNILENISKLNEVSRIIGSGRAAQLKKLMERSIQVLNDLRLCNVDSTTSELINNASRYLSKCVEDVNAGDLNRARNSLNEALNFVTRLEGRLPHIHNLRIKDLIRYIDFALSLLQKSI